MNKDIPIQDIPQHILDDIILLLKNYLVAVYIVLPEKQQSRPRPIGSGTLVEIEGKHYILTAAHVWHKARESEKIGLVLTDYQSSFRCYVMPSLAKSCGTARFQNGGLILLS